MELSKLVLLSAVGLSVALVGCGGGGGSGGSATSSTVPSSPVTVNEYAEFYDAANTIITSASTSPDDAIIASARCSKDSDTNRSRGCPPTSPEFRILPVLEHWNLDLFGFSGRDIEYETIEHDSGIPVVLGSDGFVSSTTSFDSLSLGGWLEHNFFTVGLDTYISRQLTISTSHNGLASSVGDVSGSNPTSGSASWNGVMVGIDISDTETNANPLLGDATVTVDDFNNPDVDVVFTNIVDLETDVSRNDISWQDINLTDGEFATSSDSSEISGQFYGDEHQEVGGAFVYLDSEVIGAFGAKRDEE